MYVVLSHFSATIFSFTTVVSASVGPGIVDLMAAWLHHIGRSTTVAARHHLRVLLPYSRLFMNFCILALMNAEAATITICCDISPPLNFHTIAPYLEIASKLLGLRHLKLAWFILSAHPLP